MKKFFPNKCFPCDDSQGCMKLSYDFLVDEAGSVFNKPGSDLLCPDFSQHFPNSELDFNAWDSGWEKLILLAFYVCRMGEEPLGFDP